LEVGQRNKLSVGLHTDPFSIYAIGLSISLFSSTLD
jgi:hypothetical protein